eukprot:scaffold250052_cov14-Prasinocladus_malaysianus.AAC.1
MRLLLAPGVLLAESHDYPAEARAPFSCLVQCCAALLRDLGCADDSSSEAVAGGDNLVRARERRPHLLLSPYPQKKTPARNAHDLPAATRTSC